MRQAYYVTASNDASPFDKTESILLDKLSTLTEADVSCFIVSESNDHKETLATLATIRQHDNPNVYLKPIVLITKVAAQKNALSENCDYSASRESFTAEFIEGLSSFFEKINKWIAAIPNVESISDTSTRFKVLRLMASRNLVINPAYTVEHSNGFNYPMLMPLFDKKDTSIENVLEFLAQQQLIVARSKKRAHFCSHCDCAFLNFKETCPDCRSDDIETDELIHHFKCGFTDAATNFKSNNKLYCPKCDTDLVHIGVDYDKPSTVHECNQCSHSFQEPLVLADCFNCHRTIEPDNLTLRSINSYETSAIGQNAARYGLDALFTSILSTDLKLFSRDEFKSFLTVEKSRIQRYGISKSTVAIIQLGNLELLYNKLGKKAEQVFRELSAVFKAVFRESDVITARNESIFCVLMTETSKENSKLALNRLESSVTDLFKTNADVEIEAVSTIVNVEELDDLEVAVNHFLSEEV